jgi:hypothetical protein
MLQMCPRYGCDFGCKASVILTFGSMTRALKGPPTPKPAQSDC